MGEGPRVRIPAGKFPFSHHDRHMSPSSNGSGSQPFKLKDEGSNPSGDTYRRCGSRNQGVGSLLRSSVEEQQASNLRVGSSNLSGATHGSQAHWLWAYA